MQTVKTKELIEIFKVIEEYLTILKKEISEKSGGFDAGKN